jgi:hypothetical protein
MRKLALALVCMLSALPVAGDLAQRRGGGFMRVSPPLTPWMYDGSFIFCRIRFDNSPDGDGNGWWVDYPRADLNYPFRMGQLSTARISRDARGEPNHVVLGLTDEHLFQCPFVMMTEPGGAYFSPEEAAALHTYLVKGGFLWADDFWGEYAWAVWERELRKAMPANQYRIVDLTPDHPLFNVYYVLRRIPQISSIDYWLRTGSTSERYDSQTPHVRALEDEDGRILAIMTHNTDFGDAFEREGDNMAYFSRFAPEGYAFGINVYIYAMTH